MLWDNYTTTATQTYKKTKRLEDSSLIIPLDNLFLQIASVPLHFNSFRKSSLSTRTYKFVQKESCYYVLINDYGSKYMHMEYEEISL